MSQTGAGNGKRANIQIASIECLECLTQLMGAFRDSLNRCAPTNEKLRQSLRTLLADDATDFIVAIGENGRGLGYIQQRYRYSAWLSSPEAYLEDLFVIPEVRGCHLGLRLTEFALSRAVGRGCERIGLNTNEQNKAAISLYERLGFSSESTRWRDTNQLWFEKTLSRTND
jgi:ribosomal protein S18 acetylase RimI-like enzyme